jgi:hypothetical protein
VRLQVKFSRGFGIREELTRHLIATSWYTLDPRKIRSSQADLWVFVILTLRHEEYYVVMPTRELRKCIPRGSGIKWNLYLWVFSDGSCFQVRDLGKEELLDVHYRGVRDRRRDFSRWRENWKLLDRFTRRTR